MNNNDHRVIGEKLNYFAFSEKVGKGLPLLMPKGAKFRQKLEEFIIKLEEKNMYDIVYTPSLGREYLYETSGHLSHYKDDMYPSVEISNDNHYLRPMTCPHHFMVFDAIPRSYKDLPQRYSEISTLYRREKSGGLYGLVRLMEFHLSDGHIFCTLEQVKDELDRVFKMIDFTMENIGLKDSVSLRLSLRDNEKDKYSIGEKKWEFAEKVLKEYLDESNRDYKIEKGHAAFYGPKIDVQIKTIHGKEETIFTNQLDMFLSEQFGIVYKDQNDNDRSPVVIHRSIMGCIERTMALMLEKNNGLLPFYFSPVQVKVLPLSPAFYEEAKKLEEDISNRGIRVEGDYNNYSFGKKLRDSKVEKVPYVIILGEKEINEGKVSVQKAQEKSQKLYDKNEFLDLIEKENQILFPKFNR